jgi:RNA polymerase sigma-70 factor (family 1)
MFEYFVTLHDYCLFMEEVNDIFLLRKKIANNDQLAYRQLFIMYYDKLFRFAIGFTKNKELAEEIVSDVFINIWRRRSTIENISNLKLYLYVSAKNITFNYLAKLHRENFTDIDAVEIELEAPFSDPGEAMITREMNSKLKAAIGQLPPKCKLIFKLIKEDGLSYKQTARLLHLSVSTVENQLAIAIKKIAGAIRYSLKNH